MKPVILFSLVFLSANLFAQDWALFPYKQKSYYTSSSDTSVLVEYYQDSSRLELDESVLFFNKICPLPDLQECYDEIVSAHYIFGNPANTFFFDSLILRNDTLIYYDIETSSFPFYFLPKASVGQSWSIYTDYVAASYNEIIITCDSLLYSVILPGISDSVRYYSIHSTGVDAGENYIDDLHFILSQNYGFMEFVDFKAAMMMYDSEYAFSLQTLVGLISGENMFGITPPQWDDYFNFNPGDIFIYKHHSDYIGYTDINVISIISIEHFEDSIVCYYLKDDSTFRTVYYKSVLQPLLESKINWPLVDYSIPFSDYAYYENTPITISENVEINYDLFSPDTTYLRNFHSGYYKVFEGCDIYTGFEGYTSIHYNSKLGSVYSERSHSDSGTDYTILIGAVVGGVAYGDLSALEIQSEIFNNSLLISPNPVRLVINIDIPLYRNIHYNIYNINNQLISSGKISNNQIDISFLQPGMYLLEITDDENVLKGKFVKM